MLSLQALHEEWAAHPLGDKRAPGGRVALRGFLYQLQLSLDRFFAQVLEGNRDAQFLFEGLSDVAEIQGEIVYFTQVKTTLDSRSLRSAADEALAVWHFLNERHPELLDRVRFQVAARRVRPNVPMDMGTLNADDLGLEGEDRQLWAALRTNFLPVEIRGSAKVDLAIRLWPHAMQCFTLVDSCLARLFSLLGENRSSSEIAGALLEVWDQARTDDRPPCRLLGPREFASVQTPASRIVHGVRPRPQDLSGGCFMKRATLIEAALRSIRETSLQLEASPGRRPIPIFWIVGPSGAGKSVLLLQVMRELVLQSDVEAANYLGEFAHTLPQALAYWSGVSERALIAVDDLFAPENRNPRLWQDVAELAFTQAWRRLPWILTCGPREQLTAFKSEAHRHAEMMPVEIQIETMNPEERVAYHAWYEQRTGIEVPIVSEPIFVAAAWLYELRRQAHLSPEAFADRFYSRLGDLEMQAPARAAMALNQYGLRAPAGLFTGHEAELDQLTSEQIYRLARSGAGVREGRFFHPRIAKIIYEAIIPETEARRRAEDLARAFGAMLDEGEAADDFLSWLGRAGTQTLLTPPFKTEILQAMWARFRERGPTKEVVPRLKRWHEFASAADIDLRAMGAARQIREWFESTPEGTESWGLLFQMAWDDADGRQRDALYAQGESWLEGNLKSGPWNWIWQRLWAHRPNRREMAEIGFLWLYDNPAHPGWGRVWQRIFDSGLREQDLLGSALAALPCQPESSADLPIWQKVESLAANKSDFLGAIVRKLSRVRSPYKMDQGLDFIISRVEDISLSDILSPAIADAIAEPCWPYFWQHLIKKVRADRFLELGREWLAGREDKPEWSYIWRRLVDLGFETKMLLPIGREWLAGREDKPEWAFVWQRLVELGFETEVLLPIGREWLAGREDKPEWAFVWQRLVELG
ncbi:MAG TPA: hypothetical protein VJH03_19400, partial [Blastocatellia bacterium]|nr:hypothetical protein [Blastocatellia bacterium]